MKNPRSALTFSVDSMRCTMMAYLAAMSESAVHAATPKPHRSAAHSPHFLDQVHAYHKLSAH